MLASPSGYLSPSYVSEKMHMKDAFDDALVLTEIIGHVLGRKTPTAIDSELFVGRTQNE